MPSRWLPALRDMLALLALAAGVWLIHVFGRTLPSAVMIAIWAVLTAGIAAGLFWRARIRRAALLSAYLRAGSPLASRLRGGWLMAAGKALLAMLLALLLLVALLRLGDGAVWVVAVASAPLLVLLHRLWQRVLEPHASPVYLPELAWRVTLLCVGLAMFAVLVLLAFHRSYPDFAAVGLEQAVWHLADREQARSEWLQILLQMDAAKDALRLWLAQQLMPQPGISLAQALGWLVILAQEALFVWSYLLLCSAVLIGIHRYDRQHDRQHD